MTTAMDWDILKKKHVSIGLLITLAMAGWWLLGQSNAWHQATFVTRAEAAQSSEKISGQLDQNQRILTDHIAEFRIKNALDRVDDLEMKLYYLDRDEEERGVTGSSAERRRDYTNELGNAEAYRDCLLNNRPNCEHLARRIR